MKMMGVGRAALIAGLASGALAGAAGAQTVSTTTPDTVLILGRIANGISNSDGETISASSISADDMRTYDRVTVDEALDLIPGANAGKTGGSRNEGLIFIRGFDRLQTTVSIDGVRVFLPADNRIDFGRFLTADIAEVQVSKGYVSVLNGPGGLGGAINLVTRKPTRAFEAELVAGVNADSSVDMNAKSLSALVGTRQDKFYAQLSAAGIDRDSWRLSRDFEAVNPALEDGGERGFSSSKDWRVNFKAGFTPNDTDEYVVGYVKMSGEKSAPLHISDNASTRFWDWPYIDIENIYALTRTQLTPNLELRSRIYQNRFKNLLTGYDSAAQTTKSLPRAFDSWYDDVALGANVTLAAKLSPENTLTTALHYRKDDHDERQYGFIRVPVQGNPSVNRPYFEPWQSSQEETYSLAIEDVQRIGANIDLIAGVSYDMTDLKSANDISVTAIGTTLANSRVEVTPVHYPLKDMNALNAQAAVVWRDVAGATLHASVSSRTRFPTLMERFSSRFGTSIPNPNVKPERATNFEVGGKWELGKATSFETSVFYTDLEDALVLVPVVQPAPFGTQNQTRNVASAQYLGLEASFQSALSDDLSIGGNFTWIARDFDKTPTSSNVIGSTPPTTGSDPTNPAFEPQGVPDLKAFLYASYRPMRSITITPSLELASDRWTFTSSSAITPTRLYKTGDYALLNLAFDWEVSPNVSLLLAAKNITDQNYTLVDGFPEEGRNYALSLRLRN